MLGGCVLHVHAVALGHALEQHPQVKLAHAVEHRLVHGRVVLDAHARVLGGELVQRVGEALLIAAPLRLDRDAEHRRREGDGLQVILVLVVRIVQHRVQMQLVDLGDGADVPGHGARHLARVLAHEPEEVRDLDGLARVPDEQLAPLAHRALVHAQHAELAHVRVDAHLEDVRDDVLRRIGRDRHALGALPGALEERRRVALGGVRHQPLDDLQQLGDARARLGRGETHRHEVPLAQRLLEGVVQLLRGELLALLQVQRHRAARRARRPGR